MSSPGIVEHFMRTFPCCGGTPCDCGEQYDDEDDETWCGMCGDERPCECDEQLRAEIDGDGPLEEE